MNSTLSADDLPDLITAFDVACRLEGSPDPGPATWREALRGLCAIGVRQCVTGAHGHPVWSIRNHELYAAMHPVERYRAYRGQFGREGSRP